jgi:CRISPR-associated endonuclease Cas2
MEKEEGGDRPNYKTAHYWTPTVHEPDLYMRSGLEIQLFSVSKNSANHKIRLTQNTYNSSDRTVCMYLLPWYLPAMRKLESEARYERRRGYLQDAVLAVIGTAGLLLVAMTAPNTLQLLGKLGLAKTRFSEEVGSALSRLARKGQIVFEEHHGKKYARITSAGKRALELEQQMALTRSRLGTKWDKRYRMVIFDIPERKRRLRTRLRQIMREAGFVCVQKSVWIFPYDCEDLIILLKAQLHIGKDVIYTIVEKIENDRWIKRHFGLK